VIPKSTNSLLRGPVAVWLLMGCTVLAQAGASDDHILELLLGEFSQSSGSCNDEHFKGDLDDDPVATIGPRDVVRRRIERLAIDRRGLSATTPRDLSGLHVVRPIWTGPVEHQGRNGLGAPLLC
jgi:hypothetical protein